MASSLQITKADRPELAKHDASILGKYFSRKKKFFYINLFILRSCICNGLHWFNDIIY